MTMNNLKKHINNLKEYGIMYAYSIMSLLHPMATVGKPNQSPKLEYRPELYNPPNGYDPINGKFYEEGNRRVYLDLGQTPLHDYRTFIKLPERQSRDSGSKRVYTIKSGDQNLIQIQIPPSTNQSTNLGKTKTD